MPHLFDRGRSLFVPGRSAAAGVLLFCATLSGCDGTTGADLPSEVRFEYAGDRSGTFHVRAAPAERGPVPDTAVVAEVIGWEDDGSPAAIRVQAAQVTGRTGYEEIVLWLLARKGPHELGSGPGASAQVYGRVGGDRNNLWDGNYEFRQGTVIITELTEDRIRGTLSGTAAHRLDDGVVGMITVTSGTFDVAIHPAPR